MGAIIVDRSTMWGNRWKIGVWSNTLGRNVETIQEAVELYRRHMWTTPHEAAWVRECLRGHDLVCWCPLTLPCHAEVLLEMANAP